MLDNMKIWADNWKTDPKFTRKVNQRGGFTAIDAQYKLECVTRYFGACGYGWGFDRTFFVQGLPDFPGSTHVVCDLIMWYRVPEENKVCKVPSMGSAQLYTGNDSKLHTDVDAWKKAETDALTKAFSRLGFFADVFLGMFDDDKYIEYLHQNPPEYKSIIDPLESAQEYKRAYTEDLAAAQAVLDVSLVLVPGASNGDATTLAAAANNCFRMAGLGDSFIQRVCAARGESHTDPAVAQWLWRRATAILGAMVTTYKDSTLAPDGDWMAHAKQVAQLAMCEVGDAPELLLEAAALPLFSVLPD